MRNVTYNNSAIFTKLGVHPNDLEGKACAEAIPILLKAIELSYEIDSTLRRLEPPNKWGGLEDSRSFLGELLSKCQENPKGIIHFS